MEQLRYLGAAATHVFEDIATLLIRVEHPDSMRTRLSQGDAGVDAWVADPGTDRQHVFQVKFYPGNLNRDRRDEIEKSFQTAFQSERVDMSRWTLCLPGRLSTEDATWFLRWRQGYQGITIDLWDGDKLMELLASPKAAPARRIISMYQVSGVPSGGSVLRPSVSVMVGAAVKPNYEAVLVFEIKNEGDRTANDLKAKVKFSQVACYPFGSPPPEKWAKIQDGMFDNYSDFEVHARHPLHNGDTILVTEIPCRGISINPFHLAVDIYAEDTDATHWFLSLPSSAFFKAGRHDLHLCTASARGEVKQWPVTHLSQDALRIAREILAVDDNYDRGVTLGAERNPLDMQMAAYTPWINRCGKGFRFMRKSQLMSALDELHGNGLLGAPVMSQSTKTTVYTLPSDMAERLRTVVKELAISEESDS
jgi:hypothetical protein